MDYAALWRRFLARLIDNFIVNFISFITFFFITGTSLLTTEENVPLVDPLRYEIGMLTIVLIYLAYFTFFESSSGKATPGKKSLKIFVTTGTGSKISIWQAFLRNFILSVITFLAFLPIIGIFKDTDLIWLTGLFLLFVTILGIWLSKTKQGLHDMVARTYVLKTETLSNYQNIDEKEKIRNQSAILIVVGILLLLISGYLNFPPISWLAICLILPGIWFYFSNR